MAYKRQSPDLVVEGGSGVQSATAYSVLCGGTSSTNPFQSVASLGSAAQVLTSNGAGALPTWQNVSGVYPTYTPVNSTPYVVSATDEFISVDCSGGAITIELPNAPATSRVITIKDRKGNSGTNNITVTTVGGAVTIDSGTIYIMNTNFQSINVLYDGTNYQVY